MQLLGMWSSFHCNLYYAARPGPPRKRSRLDASEPSASGASTAGPSSASGLDTKLSEWKPKEFCACVYVIINVLFLHDIVD